MYVRDKPNGPIVARKDGVPDATLTGVVATKLVPSHDGKLLAIIDKNDVAVLDAAGSPQWRHTLWKPEQLVFASDDRHLIVETLGGLVSFDAATGTRIADACAFGFGLHDKPPATIPLNAEPVCEAATSEDTDGTRRLQR